MKKELAERMERSLEKRRQEEAQELADSEELLSAAQRKSSKANSEVDRIRIRQRNLVAFLQMSVSEDRPEREFDAGDKIVKVTRGRKRLHGYGKKNLTAYVSSWDAKVDVRKKENGT